MRLVQRSEIQDYQTYTDERPVTRPRILEVKEVRRVMLGSHLLFLFENHDTVWYQIQEMIRVEKIVRESSIQEEIDVFNGLLGGPGELGVVLLIAVPEEIRPAKLSAWLDLLPTLYLKLENGDKARATWDPTQIGDTRLSSVQYLKFDVKGQCPVAVGCDHSDPSLFGEQNFTEEQIAALKSDLNDNG